MNVNSVTTVGRTLNVEFIEWRKGVAGASPTIKRVPERIIELDP